MRKKVLIVNNNLHIGGVQKALISLLWNIRDKYDVTLLLFHPEGECLNQIPPEVRVLGAGGGYRYLGMPGQADLTGKDRLIRGLYASVTRVFGRKYAIALMGLGQKNLGDYDAAVSYLHNGADRFFYGGCNDFVLKHVSAKRKITVLHCDYSLCGANTPDNNRQYGRFDAIAACSQGCADAFLKVNPHLAEKVLVVPNCHRFDRIRSQAAAAEVSLNPDKINLITVSRFGKEKGVERALEAIADLGDLKDRIHYHIIGDGAGKPAVLEALEKHRLQDCVTLWGQLENPYGCMQAADLLLIPSRSEAAPLVIGEAACLGTPILSMKTSSALEMIQETGFGWVCENHTAAMTETLARLLSEPERIYAASRNLETRQFTNDAAVSRFCNCIG